MTNLNEFIKNFNDIEAVDYPEYDFSFKKRISKKDLVQLFMKSWERAGGKAIKINQKKNYIEEIFSLNFLVENSVILSNLSFPSKLLKDYKIKLIQEDKIHEPTELDNLDLLILESKIAIASQGAIWINKNSVKFSSSLFLCKHQVFLVNKNSIFYGLEDAYSKWQKEIKYGGYWISGPSKTADIEQSLVIGAHGPLTSTVIIY